MTDPKTESDRTLAMKSWEKLSNPKVLQQNLILAGLYLVAYELLRDTVVARLKNFYSTGELDFSPRGTLIGPVKPEYSARVTALCPKDEFHASCLWLRDMRAISDDDIAALKSIREHRNELAHELPVFIAEADREVDVRRLERVRLLVSKIERWWVREVDIPCDPAYDDKEISDEDINPGTVMFLELILATALQAGEDRSH